MDHSLEAMFCALAVLGLRNCVKTQLVLISQFSLHSVWAHSCVLIHTTCSVSSGYTQTSQNVTVQLSFKNSPAQTCKCQTVTTVPVDLALDVLSAQI